MSAFGQKSTFNRFGYRALLGAVVGTSPNSDVMAQYQNESVLARRLGAYSDCMLVAAPRFRGLLSVRPRS